MLNKGKCKDFSRQQRQILVLSCPCYCSARAAGCGWGWVLHPSITPGVTTSHEQGAQGQFGSWRKAVLATRNVCPPSRSTGNHTGADGWEKRRENSKEVNQIPIQRMQESVSGALDPQGEFCWDKEEWTWGWRLQHDKVFKLCLSPLSVSVGFLANFLASDFVSDSGSLVIWKPHSSLTAKLSASFLLLILC